MKEVINISLSGISFIIEKDAYDKLCEYTNQLEASFASKGDEGKEIIDDIEARIAEILMSDKDNINSAIVLEDVEKVIEQLGYPEVEGDENDNPEPTQNKKTTQRRIYRKKEGSVIAGVLNGIATFLNTDPIFIRLAVVAASIACISIDALNDFLTYIIFTYIILWIIIPEAKTVLQKLEMDSKDINVKSINNKYREATPESKGSILMRDTGNIFLKIVRFILLTIAAILSLGTILTVISILLFSITFAFYGKELLPVLCPTYPVLTAICTFLTAILPAIMITLLLVSCFFPIKTKRAIWVISIIVWIAAAITSVVSFSVSAISPYYSKNETSAIYTNDKTKTLYVKVLDDGKDNKIPFLNRNVLYKRAYFNFEKCQDSTFTIKRAKTIKGDNLNDAIDILEGFDVPYKVKGDTVFITTGFTHKNSIFKNQRLYYTFYCPENCEIIFDREIKHNGKFTNVVESKIDSKTESEIKKEDSKKSSVVKVKGTSTSSKSDDGKESASFEIVVEEVDNE
ncbi:MAG: PspC domain-containing protein [Rikenellaceae bacterium]